MIKTITKIFFGILVFFVLTHIYFYFKHHFWYYQPVSLYTSIFLKYGKISESIPKTIDTPSNYFIQEIDNQQNFSQLQHLLNQNFRLHDNYQYHYNKQYLDWSLNTPIKSNSLQKYDTKKWNIGLYHQKDLIGFIHGKPITIKLDKQKVPCFYVDFLCIKKEYRGQHLAPVLISNMAKNGFLEEYQVFIFKKEIYPLPFRYINQYHYYLYALTNHLKSYKDLTNLQPLKENNLLHCYQFFINNSHHYQLNVDFSLQEFKHYFLNKNSYSFVEYSNNKIIGFISAFDSRFMIKKKKTCLQIQCYLGISNSLFKKICLIGIDNHFDYLMINNMGQHQELIDQYSFQKISNCYIHFYNFHINSTISCKNIFFPIP
jgi:hypothetical protein